MFSYLKILAAFVITLQFTIFSTFVMAQITTAEAVFLKNGSMIKGTIIEQIPNTSIKIRTQDGSVFHYRFDEIEKITKESQDSLDDRLQPITPTYTPNKKEPSVSASSKSKDMDRGRRYMNITEYIKSYNTTSGMVSVPSVTSPDSTATVNDVFGGSTVMIRMVNGAHINEFLSIGFGLGFEFAKAKDDYVYAQMPLSFDIRTAIIPGPFSPIIGTGIGYSIGLDSTYKGGFIINPTIGVRLFLSKRFALLMNIGYKYQKMTRVINNNEFIQGPLINPILSEKRTNDLKFTTISIGVSF